MSHSLIINRFVRQMHVIGDCRPLAANSPLWPITSCMPCLCSCVWLHVTLPCADHRGRISCTYLCSDEHKYAKCVVKVIDYSNISFADHSFVGKGIGVAIDLSDSHSDNCLSIDRTGGSVPQIWETGAQTHRTALRILCTLRQNRFPCIRIVSPSI